MTVPIKSLSKLIVITGFLWQTSLFPGKAQPNDVGITIHLRGVYESNISLLSLTGSKIFKPIAEVQGVKNGETTQILVSQENLPGEFVLRFDYKEKETSTPYPSEKHIFISDQDLELWASPMYCNNADSTWFQKGERENATLLEFLKENGRKKEKLGLLQNFLMKYDDTGSKFYEEGIKEYKQRRQSYNQWLKTREQQDNQLFISKLYCFQYIPEIPWKGTETDRINNLINHYFDGFDFKNSLIIKTSELNKWMENYVNLYGKLSTTTALRDSLLPLAGKTAIEKAREGHPLVYGWMVDYFYRGYETNGLTAGMKILEPYLNDSGCLTSKRQEITRRLKGMQTLVAGSIAPNITLKDSDGNNFELGTLQTPCRYILVLFWSAGCSHCVEMTDILYKWQQQPEIQQKMTVLAISLDETDLEKKAWDQKILEIKGWKHILAEGGVRSKVASDYLILAIPSMILIDAKTKQIVAMPDTLKELMVAIK
ncbi:MAG: thioredoxin-like domain-containing protein [Bacteroidetes bacterium]|nr:thioredoxin-like domain-containing protein [Bacteroidota bacterium]